MDEDEDSRDELIIAENKPEMVSLEETGVDLSKRKVETNLTSFFREDHHFHALKDDLKPFVGKPVRIWCCAASTGEEPYSIAMHLLEKWPGIDAHDVEILSSDIDTQVLDAAQRGVYSARSIANLPKSWLDKYFTRRGEHEWVISRDLVAAVEFSRVNLSDPADTRRFRDIDLIFCRNLLIYFDDQSRRAAAEAMYDALRPGGFVCLGHSESMSRISALYRVRRFADAMVYQKPLNGEAP